MEGSSSKLAEKIDEDDEGDLHVFFFGRLEYDCKTLEKLWGAAEAMVVECRRRNVDVPKDIAIWSDNTVSENKNMTVLTFLAWLIGTAKFQCASLSCALTGHTHNRLDQVFGLLATCFRYVERLSCPLDVTTQIKQLVSRMNLQQWLGSDTSIDVHYVRSIYNWKSWLTCFQLD